MKIRAKIVDLLLWSQKYTKADMLYLAKGGFWITFNQAINSLLSLILIVAFANLLPKETYGVYRYILSIAGVLNIFTLTGMNSAVSRAVARGAEGALQTTVRYQLKWNSLMLLAFLTLSGYYFIKDENVFATSFLILGLFLPFTLAFGTYGAYLTGKKEFKLANILSVVSTLIYFLGIFATLLVSKEVVWLVAVYAITTFTSSLIFYLYTVHTFKPPTDADAEETLNYGKTLTYIKLLGPITSQIDKIILAHFWGPAQLATYSLAMAIPSKGGPALKNLVDIGFPKFVGKTPEQINAVFYRRIFQGMFVGTIVTILYVLAAPYLFKYLLPQYIEGVRYSQILALSFIFALPTRYISLLFESQKMSSQIFTNSLTNSLLAIALYVILGIWGGIWGLVVAYVAWYFLGMMVNLVSWRMSSKA